MAEITFNSIASATRNRNQIARDQQLAAKRVAENRLSVNRHEDIQNRRQLTVEQALSSQKSLQLRRNDLEADFELTLLRNKQSRHAEALYRDTLDQNRRDDLIAERAADPLDRTAIRDRGPDAYDESRAIDQTTPDVEAPPPPPDIDQADQFRQFLAERDERNAERARQQLDQDIQRQIDLRITDDNLRTPRPDAELPRGALVDIFG